jgi:hypothetical protein
MREILTSGSVRGGASLMEVLSPYSTIEHFSDRPRYMEKAYLTHIMCIGRGGKDYVPPRTSE